ncbi:heme-binding protein [Actimicrobium sp. CCI2.3]|uniref:SOUL family heme-binding protein n=1 Tax=Actimicrobium sp. CCI2.3 TaxID=3048616 RepID=UPI002AB544B9|nr:heme-binding protein [Actimicrobium sp. CCI2.3]MDY7575808.1 heme-binding protein [Actimicrobium sp. CCI2.3]MEB0021621.1 heme-binding protein [Actimicrobium sp. CCI2.3]
MATEEPAHTVSIKEESFEVRDYPALIAAEVTVSGSRSEAVSSGFKLLAGYIFGGNTRQQRIAMTAPVLQENSSSSSVAIPMTAPVTQTAQGNQWTIRFMMPAAYTLDSLPVPDNPQVRLRVMPATRVAVVRFSGLAGEDSIVEKTAELDAFVTRRQLLATGPATLARYDPPWTPWFMRRNELMLPLALPENLRK